MTPTISASAAGGSPVHIHWFRRDLRLRDHRALYAAVHSGAPVLPLFIFDSEILDRLSDRYDRRVHFIQRELVRLNQELSEAGSGLLVRHGRPIDVWKTLLEEWAISSVSVVRDYEPYARQRDRSVYELLDSHGISMKGYKDQVITEKYEILTRQGEPYKVFTPYSKSWKRFLDEEAVRTWPVDLSAFLPVTSSPRMPSLKSIGFRETDETLFPSRTVTDECLARYGDCRDTPSFDGTSRLSVHLRFGTVSIRSLVERASRLSETFLNELIWRDFFQMTLYHHPDSPEKAIRPEYDRIRWEQNETHFQAWCRGQTGYPLVDAGMRQLNRTGYMHNRLRMVTASFLTRHLLIDWRKGERYFAEKLLDFDLAANVGGWQWAAGSGRDAAPWFRIFNPQRQREKFDPEDRFIRQYVPEHGSKAYPEPIVNHRWARERALARYREAVRS